MSPHPILLEAERLACWYLVMLFLAGVYAFLLIFFPKRIDPLPLLPLCGLVLAVQTGVRLAVVWFGMHFQYHDFPLDFWSWWRYVTEVPEPMVWVFTALIGHGVIHWAIALCPGWRKRKDRMLNLCVHLCVILCLCITLHVAYSLFDFLILGQKRYMETFQPPRSLYVNWPEAPHPEEKWFRILFVETDSPPYFWAY